MPGVNIGINNPEIKQFMVKEMVVDRNKIKDWIAESIAVKEAIRHDPKIRKQIETAAALMYRAIKDKHKILVCGNGGSASDSAHFVGELLNRFTMKREYPLPAIDLSASNSTITAIANDYEFKYIFSKQVEALGEKGDVLLAITTSGNSANVRDAVYAAKDKGMFVVFLTGIKNAFYGDYAAHVQQINVPSDVTPLIQESHIMIIHILCHLIDEYLEKSL
jgi:D-sedoheptulose 7-phosphate isomerase